MSVSVPLPSFSRPSELAPPLGSASGVARSTFPPAFDVSIPRNEPGRKPSVAEPSAASVATSEVVNSPAPPTLTARPPPLPVIRLAAVQLPTLPPYRADGAANCSTPPVIRVAPVYWLVPDSTWTPGAAAAKSDVPVFTSCIPAAPSARLPE